jgi:transposase
MKDQLKYRVKLARSLVRKFMADQPPSVVMMEACDSAHYWAREMINPVV